MWNEVIFEWMIGAGVSVMEYEQWYGMQRLLAQAHRVQRDTRVH